MHETENANPLVDNLSKLLEMLADAIDTGLRFPEKWWQRGFITGRATYIKRLDTLRVHVWIDPRIEGYTFVSTETGNTPIMRFDTEFDASTLAGMTNQEELLQSLYERAKIDLDDCEVNGLPGMGIEAVSKDA